MQALYIPASNETPEIHFDYASHKLAIRGESYPENAMSFYAPVRASLQSYLEAAHGGAPIRVEIALRYFNSASTKLIRALVAMLNATAVAGRKVVLDWHHDAEDDMMIEFGQDLSEEHNAIEFRAVAQAEACAA